LDEYSFTTERRKYDTLHTDGSRNPRKLPFLKYFSMEYFYGIVVSCISPANVGLMHFEASENYGTVEETAMVEHHAGIQHTLFLSLRLMPFWSFWIYRKTIQTNQMLWYAGQST